MLSIAANNGTHICHAKLLTAISVFRVFVPITDMVEIAISATDPITDLIIGTSLKIST